MKLHILVGLVLVLLACPIVSSAETPNALLTLDSLSFVANALDNGEQIPLSGIPVRVESQSGNSWLLYIEPADVDLPPVTFNNGERVKWTLMERAVGTATFVNGQADVTISARFLAQSLDSSREVQHSLSFTTRVTQTERGDLEVEREGVPLDPSSGYVQLVASASDPPRSEHGIPFFVVLSGRFSSGPSGFLAP